MPIHYLRRLTGKERTRESNRELALVLAFIAGATNAGGFLAVKQYTSHMSGIVSAMADNSALGDIGLVLSGVSALTSFVAGAALTAILVNWGRRRRMHSLFALPILVEAALLLVFGLLGSNLEARRWLFDPATVLLLCFTMGLQNAIITKISNAEIRTTHITGVVTDIGIELGKLLYWNRSAQTSNQHPSEHDVRADRKRLALLASLVGLFFLGGIAGALGFKHLGFASTLPLAAILLILAIVPIWDDLHTQR